jgi:hypothetical protein
VIEEGVHAWILLVIGFLYFLLFFFVKYSTFAAPELFTFKGPCIIYPWGWTGTWIFFPTKNIYVHPSYFQKKVYALP